MKSFFRLICPPVLLILYKKIFLPKEFIRGFNDWKTALDNTTTYNAEEIFSKTLDSARKVRDGLATYERDSVLFDEIQYDWQLLASLLLIAKLESNRLNVADYGGALGTSYRQNKEFLDMLDCPVKWVVVEQSRFVQIGKSEFENEVLLFSDSLNQLKNDKPRLKTAYMYQSAEVYIHQQFMNSPNRVFNPNDADLFYVPIYPSTWLSGRSHDLTTRERTRSKLLKSIEWIRHMSPFWDRYQGADHIFTFTSDQGSCFDIRRERNEETLLAKRVTHALRNAIHLSTLGDQKSSCFIHERDIVIPPMIRHFYHKFQGGTFTNFDLKPNIKILAKPGKINYHWKKNMFKHHVSFRGQLSLENEKDPWLSIVMLYGSFEQQKLFIFTVTIKAV